VQPPVEMQKALMPDGVTSQPRLPSLAAPPPATAERGTRRVELAELDSVAHVNNAHYAVYVEQAVCDALAACGWRVDPLQRPERLRLLRHDLEYFAEAQYDDRLDSAVWAAPPQGNEFASECALSRDGARVLHASSRWGWSALELPAPLRGALSALAA
jgi:acyl-CoA thioesterase FadM